jgi:putative SOS response-associated peptidase YedK
MCGRYGFSDIYDFIHRFDVSNQIELTPRYNVAPGQDMPVITRHSPNTAEWMRWGLIPFWAKDPHTRYRTINARAETVTKKPAFRRAFAHQRCLVPASGFFEWRQTDRQPYYIHLKRERLFAIAGIYDVWKDKTGEAEIKSYALITTTPNRLMAPIHHRMPVILKRADEDAWLDVGTPIETLAALLKPYPAEAMAAYPVSKLVNNAHNDTPAVMQRAEGGDD